MRSCSNLA